MTIVEARAMDESFQGQPQRDTTKEVVVEL